MVSVLPFYSRFSALFSPFWTVLISFITLGSFLFLPKNGEIPVQKVEKRQNGENVAESGGKTDLGLVYLRGEVEYSVRFCSFRPFSSGLIVILISGSPIFQA